LVRAEARQLSDALDFLNAARAEGLDQAGEQVTLYPAVPMAMQKVANAERAQMLIESSHRGALQQFLAVWSTRLQAQQGQHRRVLRWAIDVDPQAI
jgi:primosomal protein N' (replication factor Y)